MATLTVFPDPGKPGTTSVDGDVGTNGNSSWDTAHSIADCVDCSSSGTITTESSVGDPFGTGALYSVIRALINFDTSALGGGANVSAATFSIKPQAQHQDYQTGATVRLVPNTITSHVNYTIADYGLIGTAALSNNEPAISSMSTGVYIDFPLNASGLANIVRNGISHFGLRTSIDIANVAPLQGTDPNFPGSGGCLVFYDSADQTGTASDPKLVITYTAPVGNPGGGFFMASNN